MPAIVGEARFVQRALLLSLGNGLSVFASVLSSAAAGVLLLVRGEGALRRRLVLSGDLAAEKEKGDLFDADVTEAVRRFPTPILVPR